MAKERLTKKIFNSYKEYLDVGFMMTREAIEQSNYFDKSLLGIGEFKKEMLLVFHKSIHKKLLQLAEKDVE